MACQEGTEVIPNACSNPTGGPYAPPSSVAGYPKEARMTLRIIRAAEGETVRRTGQPIFEGEVHGHALTGSDSQHIGASLVHFAPGARTRMHRHTSEQFLYVMNGIGQVGDRDGVSTIVTGDAVVIPPDTDHWHGAGDTGSPMTHLTVMRTDSQTTVL